VGDIDPRLGELLAEYLESERSPQGSRARLTSLLKLSRDTNDRVLQVEAKLATHTAAFAEWRKRVDYQLSRHDDWEATTGSFALDQLKADADARRQLTKRIAIGVGVVLANVATALVTYYLG
jgi:hypothetical protein